MLSFIDIYLPTKLLSSLTQPDNKTIKLNEKYGSLLKDILNQKNYSYIEGTTWTTDAFYRETKDKVADMKSLGAICVEMEAAALQAVCDFRNIDLITFFYAADNLDSDYWDKRSLLGKEKIDDKILVMDLALELADRM